MTYSLNFLNFVSNGEYRAGAHHIRDSDAKTNRACDALLQNTACYICGRLYIYMNGTKLSLSDTSAMRQFIESEEEGWFGIG